MEEEDAEMKQAKAEEWRAEMSGREGRGLA